ncbi:MAG: cytochrome bc complex cytochrome b subunit [Chloroflexi bacterium]|nr:cytochrome bc complex cytochrome b subunit [Chloroflexota bacterium]
MSVLPVPSILDDIKEKGVRKAVYETLDRTTERITAGMNLQDIREALRGDKPSRRPNPRLTPHADGFWLHMRPSYYHTSVTGLYPTFRLGWLSTFFFAFEIITGLFLMIFYTPSPDVAYNDMKNILGNVPLGQLMRDLHRLGAEAMVTVVALHMLRTFITGSYKKPRQFTWLTGVILLLVTLFLSFSGYLLPWDQLAFWAVTIGTSMAEAAPPQVVGTNVNLLLRGAPDIGAGGLLRFYLLHVFALPLITTIFIGVHYYKVVLHGHSLPPREEEVGKDTAKRVPMDRRTYYIPDIMSNELAWIGMVGFILVLLCLWFFHAPLENHADPQVTPLHTTAPWYFLWLQGMLKLGDKVIMGVVLPTLIFGFLFALPYIDLTPSRRYAHRRIALSGGMLTCFTLIVLTFMGTPHYGVSTAANDEVAQVLIPMEGVGAIRSIPFDELKANLTASRSENVIWTVDVDAWKNATPRADFDANILARDPNVIAITDSNIDQLEEQYKDNYPTLWKAIEEFHHLLFEEFPDNLPNAVGYMSISLKQENLARIYILMTWDVPELDKESGEIIMKDDEPKLLLDVDGNPIRSVSGKQVYIHQESEWHEH